MERFPVVQRTKSVPSGGEQTLCVRTVVTDVGTGLSLVDTDGQSHSLSFWNSGISWRSEKATSREVQTHSKGLPKAGKGTTPHVESHKVQEEKGPSMESKQALGQPNVAIAASETPPGNNFSACARSVMAPFCSSPASVSSVSACGGLKHSSGAEAALSVTAAGQGWGPGAAGLRRAGPARGDRTREVRVSGARLRLKTWQRPGLAGADPARRQTAAAGGVSRPAEMHKRARPILLEGSQVCGGRSAGTGKLRVSRGGW